MNLSYDDLLDMEAALKEDYEQTLSEMHSQPPTAAFFHERRLAQIKLNLIEIEYAIEALDDCRPYRGQNYDYWNYS